MADVKYFKGQFLVWALNAHEFRRDVGGTQLPYVRHETLGAAARAAEKLHEQMPDTTFVVIREVARVKTICARPASAPTPETEMANG